MATILIIEDEAALVKTLAVGLSHHQVISADTAAEGFRQAQRQQPDLILLDILLPDGSGVEVIRQLKAEPTTVDIPVLVLTNLDDPQTVQQILAAGGRDYLVKTDWSMDQLVAKIEEHLAGGKKP